MEHSGPGFLPNLLMFLAAAVIAVPVFKRLRLGSTLGYLIAGIVIGPSGLAFFTETGSIMHTAELGIVLLLFVIGLELQLSRLLAMRRDIFGLGGFQLAGCTLLFTLIGGCLGLPWSGAVIAGIALALSATSIALQVLNERGELQAPYGQRSFSVLLFQDISVVPILAIIPLFAVTAMDGGHGRSGMASAGVMIGSMAAVFLAGRYLLNPLFKILASTGAREVMTAAALLVVLGTALLMQWAGMSMALGAFLAGVMLAESNFRHELEADIEPFRGLLLGLFFMGVGMSIDGVLVLGNVWSLLALAIGLVVVKTVAVAVIFRVTGSPLVDALRAGVTLSPAGEFAFVLVPLGLDAGFLLAGQAAFVSALAALTMLFSPLMVVAVDFLLRRYAPAMPQYTEDYSDAHGKVLVIGFGRFGQVVTQVLRTSGAEITIIDLDVDMIDVAARFGSKVYFGDGGRLDVLRAAGAADTRIICVCIDDKATAVRVVEMAKAEFPLAQVFSRAYDRQHVLALSAAGADFTTREMFESSMAFGRRVIEELGVDSVEADEIIADVRDRDYRRLLAQQQGGLYAGLDLVNTRRLLTPEPLERPEQVGVTINEEAIRAEVAAREEEETG